MHLNISYSDHNLPGYTNVNYFSNGSKKKELPYAEKSIDEIFSENLLEKLTQGEGVRFLRECRRILKPGGVLKIITTDLDEIITEYKNNLEKRILPWAENPGEMLNHLMRSDGNNWLYSFQEICHLAELAGFDSAEKTNHSSLPFNASLESNRVHSLNITAELLKKGDVEPIDTNPLVSILIPAFNWKYFEEALQSALDQTYTNTEIIIFDDSEGEAISAIVNKFSTDKRIKYFKNTENIGGKKNCTRCLSIARGEYVKFLNDDDKLENNCVEKLLEFFRQDQTLTIITSVRRIIDENGVVQPHIYATNPIVPETSVLDGVSAANLMLRAGVNFIGEPSTVLLKTEDLRRIKPHFLEYGGIDNAIGAADVALYLNLLSKGSILYVNETLSFFRIHGEQQQQSQEVRLKGLETWNALRFHAHRLGFLAPNDNHCLEYKPVSGDKWKAIDYSSNKLERPKTAGEVSEQQAAQEMNNDFKLYHQWWENSKLLDADYEFFSNVIVQQEDQFKIHFLINVVRGKEELLADTLDTIAKQVYTRWYVSVIADFACPDPMFDDHDQLQWVKSSNGANPQVFEAVTSLEASWYVRLKAGDTLDPAFLYYLFLYAKDNPSWKFIYTDEDVFDAQGTFIDHKFKPDFSLDLIRSTNYVGFGCAISRVLFAEIPNLDTFDSIDVYKVLLQTYDRFGGKSIGHIPILLYHSLAREAQDEVEKSRNKEIEVLKHHLERNGADCTISDGAIERTYFVQYKHAESPLVSMIIPTKDNVDLLKRCILSIYEKTVYKNYEILIIDNDSTDPATVTFLKTIAVSHPNMKVLAYNMPFNFSAMNNFAVKEAKGEYILLLNDDTEVLQRNWLDRMLQHAQIKNVGAVGARLVYTDKRIQHAGIVAGIYPLAHHPGIGQDMSEPGYMNRLQVVQNASAVTAACLLVKKSKYLEVGGLDEKSLKVLYNDVDFCFKLGKAGYRNVWTPYATLIHQGSSSLTKKKSKKQTEKAIKRTESELRVMKERWADLLANDPCYNRNLSLRHTDWRIDHDYPVPWDPHIIDRPKIIGLPGLSVGAAHYRVQAPLNKLRSAGLSWSTVFSFAQASTLPSDINLKRIAPDSFLFHTVFCKKEILKSYKEMCNTFLIYGLDDLVTHVPANNPTKASMPKNVNKILRDMLSLCDRLIVSTEPLHDQIKKKNMISDIRIVPNCLDNMKWLHLQPLKQQGKKIRVGWAGAQQHHGDIDILSEVVAETYKEVEWVFFGMCPENLRNYVHEFHPAVALDEYPEKLARLNFDLAVAPLEMNKFNEAKSNLRLLEYGVLGIPVVATEIFPYQNTPAKTVENDKDQWIEAIRERIYDIDSTEKEGRRLRKWVVENYLLENNLELWMEVLTP